MIAASVGPTFTRVKRTALNAVAASVRSELTRERARSGAPLALQLPNGTTVADEFARLRRAPAATLARPVVIFKGWRAFDSNAAVLARRLRALTGADARTIRHYNYNSTPGVPVITRRLAGEMRKRFPAAAEFDVVGVSMGGLIGRQFAATNELRVRTLYTLVTPHRGAQLATFTFPIDVSTLHLRAGSRVLKRLDAALDDPNTRPERIVTYTRTRDLWVGDRNTYIRPPRAFTEARLSRTPPLALAHLRATSDPLITIDIARRLRGEPPLPTTPA
jgi:pimeloyl-ACP methyl ester carboxylesterase